MPGILQSQVQVARCESATQPYTFVPFFDTVQIREGDDVVEGVMVGWSYNLQTHVPNFVPLSPPMVQCTRGRVVEETLGAQRHLHIKPGHRIISEEFKQTKTMTATLVSNRNTLS